MKRPQILLSPPHLSGREQEYLTDAVASNWIAPVGPYLDRFEEAMERVVGTAHAIGLSSGTAALHLAMRQLGIQSGDEVLCSSLTFCASANPIVYESGTPVFLDSESSTGNIDPQRLSDELKTCALRGKLPKAVIVVDIFGNSVDMEAVLDAANRYNVPVVEDSAEALGTTYQGKHVGSLPWASVFSFNGNKILTTSGGGVLCCNDRDLAEATRQLAAQAREPAPHYEHEKIGYNYRLSNLLAAIGVAQLELLDERVAARRSIHDYYESHFRDVPGISMLSETPRCRANRWLSVIRIDPELFGVDREVVRLALNDENIETRPVWKPLHLQPVYRSCRSIGGAVAERLFEQGLCLPSGSALTECELARIIRCITRLYRRKAKLPSAAA